ncbi:DUF2783 domain-containing protein [Herbaspirillum sp. AP02]|uniref:DUF2783 domain-containing protein n=1 Tax=unclassified Herbaspirillum TaxID=2624150 RepID=UPI0015D99ACB|nr:MULTISPECIES: DUF2783 domain-containing protein [unclassified Herbaspirillum]MBG7619060.1 DUF2783 domain-containing protein [Herbaspirillum sp. AP02]NZD66344.1 DUF2783 domain-containing protein [Herbaspirillum sp. AP21]
MILNTSPNLARPDDFYEALIAMHRDLDDDASQAVNARLILLLCNHIGGHEVLLEGMQRARASVTPATAAMA